MLKKVYVLFAVILSCILITACKEKNENVLKVGINVDFPPFEYYENGKPAGFDVDLINEIGKELNKEIKLEEMEFNTLLASLSSGKVDLIISGMDITEERKQQVDFTQGYYSNELALIVPSNSDIKNLDDLKNKKVGTELGTSGDNYVSELKDVKNIKFNDSPSAVMNLKSNKVDAVITDKPVAEKILTNVEGCKILENISIKTSEMGIAVNKNNKELLNDLNKALTELKNNGKLKELNIKYFSSNK